MKTTGRFQILFLVLNILFACLLFLAYLAAWVSPIVFWPLAFLPFLYPYLVIINFAFLIFWLIQWRPYLLISFFAILIGFNQFVRLVQFDFGENEKLANHQKEIKVMSFNVRVFDLYNWKKNKNTRDKIFKFIQSENPDIVCFQEFYTDEGKHFIHQDSIKKALGLPYTSIFYTSSMKGSQHWGIATYSRFPIVNSSQVAFTKKSNNCCIYSDLRISKKIYRIYNLHLQSLHFKKQEYKILDGLSDNSSIDLESQEVSASRRILSRMKHAFIKRAAQADAITESISKSPYPVIVCGDFNDSPFSYAYHRIASELSDSFVESGIGFAPTYNGKLPPLRIDFILHSSSLKSYSFKTPKVDLSDHFPVTCCFAIP